MSTTTEPAAQPQLIRALGRRDLVLLFVVAVFNLNVVPSIAANGGVTIWLWIISLLLFFWPQGIAVIELAHRYPGEGGVYLWAKEVFGDFHGFLSGWCYWTNNMLYVPTIMLYFVGVSVYALGPGHQGLADNKFFAAAVSLALLALLTLLNILGLGVGKWINNLGAIGTFIAAAVLIGLGVVICSRFGTAITAADFKIPANPRFVLNSFGVICFASLLTQRPLMFYINRQFVAGDDPAKLEWWNGLWQYPGFRAGQRTVTAVWGVAYLAEAILRIVFALIMSPAEVVSISPIMAFGVTIALIVWTRRYLLALRERRIRELQLIAPSS